MDNIKFITRFFTGFLSAIVSFVTSFVSFKLNLSFMAGMDTTTGSISALFYIPINSIFMLISAVLAITSVISLSLCIPQSSKNVKVVTIIFFVLAIGVFTFSAYNFAVFANVLGTH